MAPKRGRGVATSAATFLIVRNWSIPPLSAGETPCRSVGPGRPKPVFFETAIAEFGQLPICYMKNTNLHWPRGERGGAVMPRGERSKSRKTKPGA